MIDTVEICEGFHRYKAKKFFGARRLADGES